MSRADMAVPERANGAFIRGALGTVRSKAWICGLLLTSLAMLAAWRVVAIAKADRTAWSNPAQALRWVPDHPQALLNLAEQQLARGRIDQAGVTARRLLAAEPLEGRGFALLAEAEAIRGDHRLAAALYAIAARRSPRDLRAHAWLVEHFLVNARYADALKHVDAILRVAPRQAEVLFPPLVRLAADPVFAQALAQWLQLHTQWRTPLLGVLHQQAGPEAGDALMSALERVGNLSEPEAAQWVAQLLRKRRWSKAYAVWASRLHPAPDALELVFNGNFDRPATGWGFDWHVPAIAGVTTDLVAVQGTRGRAAHAVFRGRPVAQVDLEQPLLLAAGRYGFSARMRAQALLSDSGLEWNVTCDGEPQPVATSKREMGSFEWREVSMEVTIPPGCHGQWLRLSNPAPAGFTQQVSGEVWFDDVAIRRRIESDAQPGGVVLRPERGRAMVSHGNGFIAADAPTPLAEGDRVLVMDGSIANLDYGGGCLRPLRAADVHVVAGQCPTLDPQGGVSVHFDAARLAVSMGVRRMILDTLDPRPPIPVGR